MSKAEVGNLSDKDAAVRGEDAAEEAAVKGENAAGEAAASVKDVLQRRQQQKDSQEVPRWGVRAGTWIGVIVAITVTDQHDHAVTCCGFLAGRTTLLGVVGRGSHVSTDVTVWSGHGRDR